MRLPSYRASAAMRLAEVQARAGRWDRTQQLLTESLKFAPEDLRAAEELVAVLVALGKTTEAQTRAKERLTRFPLSDFIREELGSPNLAHLAGDPYRVLNIAYEYARLGLYRQAVKVLSREYPAAKADQTEPGAGAPQNHPLVVYFRGYCREKLGEDAQKDYSQASRLSTLYIFPTESKTCGHSEPPFASTKRTQQRTTCLEPGISRVDKQTSLSPNGNGLVS